MLNVFKESSPECKMSMGENMLYGGNVHVEANVNRVKQASVAHVLRGVDFILCNLLRWRRCPKEECALRGELWEWPYWEKCRHCGTRADRD